MTLFDMVNAGLITITMLVCSMFLIQWFFSTEAYVAMFEDESRESDDKELAECIFHTLLVGVILSVISIIGFIATNDLYNPASVLLLIYSYIVGFICSMGGILELREIIRNKRYKEK